MGMCQTRTAPKMQKGGILCGFPLKEAQQATKAPKNKHIITSKPPNPQTSQPPNLPTPQPPGKKAKNFLPKRLAPALHLILRLGLDEAPVRALGRLQPHAPREKRKAPGVPVDQKTQNELGLGHVLTGAYPICPWQPVRGPMDSGQSDVFLKDRVCSPQWPCHLPKKLVLLLGSRRIELSRMINSLDVGSCCQNTKKEQNWLCHHTQLPSDW